MKYFFERMQQQQTTAENCGFDSWLNLSFDLMPLYSDYGIMSVEYARNAARTDDDDIFSFRGFHNFKEMERAALDSVYFGISNN